MPRGQKSKNRASQKHHQPRGNALAVEDSQASAGEEERLSTSSSSPPGPSAQYCLTPPEPVELPISSLMTFTAVTVGSFLTADDDDGDQDNDGEATGSLEDNPSLRDPLIRRMSLLVQFLLHKFSMNEPITKVDMMKIINKKYKERFPEVLHRVSEHMELVFGLDLKEVDPKAQSFVLVTTLEFSRDEYLSGGRKLPKYGLLMPLLGIIYLFNNQVSEEMLWEFLNKLRIYDGKQHFFFGEPRKLITKHFVQEKYLEYRQVSGSDPPCYEFLWGPRAEDSKTKVMAFLCKVYEMDHVAFRVLYRETWREEEQQTAALAWFGVGVNGRARARFRAKSSKFLQASRQ